MLGTRPQPLTIADNAQHDIEAAPGTGKAIQVLGLLVSSNQAVVTTVSVKEGTDVALIVDLAANNDAQYLDLGSAGWLLPEDTALTAQQTVNGSSVHITAFTRVVAAQELQN